MIGISNRCYGERFLHNAETGEFTHLGEGEKRVYGEGRGMGYRNHVPFLEASFLNFDPFDEAGKKDV